MGKTLAILVLASWAVVATLVAANPGSRKEEANTGESRGLWVTPKNSSEMDHLRGRIRELEETLTAALQATSPPPGRESDSGCEARSITERVCDILDQERTLQESGNWTWQRARSLRIAMFRLLAEDAEVQGVLAEQLRGASTDEEVSLILTYLVWSRFAQLTTRNSVVDRVRQIGRSLLDDENPHRREAAARVLLRYRGAEREDWLRALGRLDSETVPSVREALVDGLTVAARGLDLTREEIRPFLEHVRRGIEGGRRGWVCVLAEWSDSGDDFDWICQQLETEGRPARRQDLLNAFGREGRIVRGREDEARALLLRVLTDPSEDAGVRGLAATFLRSYVPWDRATADAVRSFREESSGR